MVSVEQGLVLVSQPLLLDAATWGSSRNPEPPDHLARFCWVTAWEQDFYGEKFAPGPHGQNWKLPKLWLARWRRPLQWQSNRQNCPSCVLPAVALGHDFVVTQTGSHKDSQAQIRLPGEIVQFPFKEDFMRKKPWVSCSEHTAWACFGKEAAPRPGCLVCLLHEYVHGQG